MDGSPPGSPVPGILQARTLEWVAKDTLHFFLSFIHSFLHLLNVNKPSTHFVPSPVIEEAISTSQCSDRHRHDVIMQTLLVADDENSA